MSITVLHSTPRSRGQPVIYLLCTEDLLLFKGYYEQRNCPYLFASLALFLSECQSFQDLSQQVFFPYPARSRNLWGATYRVTSPPNGHMSMTIT